MFIFSLLYIILWRFDSSFRPAYMRHSWMFSVLACKRPAHTPLALKNKTINHSLISDDWWWSSPVLHFQLVLVLFQLKSSRCVPYHILLKFPWHTRRIGPGVRVKLWDELQLKISLKWNIMKTWTTKIVIYKSRPPAPVTTQAMTGLVFCTLYTSTRRRIWDTTHLTRLNAVDVLRVRMPSHRACAYDALHITAHTDKDTLVIMYTHSLYNNLNRKCPFNLLTCFLIFYRRDRTATRDHAY